MTTLCRVIGFKLIFWHMKPTINTIQTNESMEAPLIMPSTMSLITFTMSKLQRILSVEIQVHSTVNPEAK